MSWGNSPPKRWLSTLVSFQRHPTEPQGNRSSKQLDGCVPYIDLCAARAVAKTWGRPYSVRGQAAQKYKGLPQKAVGSRE